MEAELGLSVELTPREHHEGVGRAERNNDLLTRTAEAALQRAGLGTQWLLPARAYAQWLWNRRTAPSTPMGYSVNYARRQGCHCNRHRRGLQARSARRLSIRRVARPRPLHGSYKAYT